MLADRRLLLKVITMAPIGAGILGFLAAAFFHWNFLNRTRKPLAIKPPLVEPSAKPSPIVENTIKPLPSAYQSKVFMNVAVPPSQKVVALTFDDGPLGGPTEKVLKILKDNNIKATFFLIGRNAQANPQLVKEIFAAGHVIGNHSWTHPYNKHTLAGSQAEIDKTSDVIASIIGVRPNLFRPPGGLMHTGLAEYAKSQKMGIALWSADSIDYRARNSPARLIRNVLKEVKPGGIILMHDGGIRRTNTAQALPVVIKQLRAQSYKFVTLPELIAMDTKLTSKHIHIAHNKPKMVTTKTL